jgi:3-dehydroquinate dehydratase-2
MRILVINGPNLNLLGRREAALYGGSTLAQIEDGLRERAAKLGGELTCFQSNHEGALIEFIQAEAPRADGVLINPGALAHYGYALYDSLVDCGLPVVEVHLTNIHAREEWRRRSVTAAAAAGLVAGFKAESYYLGLEALVSHIKDKAER